MFNKRPRIVFLYVMMSFAFLCFHLDVTHAITLEEAFSTALEHNELVNISRKNVVQAREKKNIVSSGLWPSLQLEVTRKKQKTGGASFDSNRRNSIGVVRFTQPIYRGGKTWFGRWASQYNLKAARRNHFRRKQEILLNVARRFYQVHLARRHVEISRNALERAEKQLDRAKAQFEVQAISRTPVLRAKVQVADAREQLQRTKNNYDVAREEFALEIGYDTPPARLNVTDTPSVNPKSIEFYQAQALDSRRDLSEARFTLRKFRENVKVKKSSWFPSIDFKATGEKFDEEIRSQEDDWTVSAVASYPLFNGWKDQSEIDKARAQYRQSEQRIRRLKREIKLEVRRAYLNLQSQKDVIETVENRLESARENYQQVIAQFQEGVASSVDVSDAMTVFNEAEFRLANERTQYRLDWLRLQFAVGTFQEHRIQRESELR
ncbi:MAG: TolC family protein [bacterium]